MRRKDQYTSNWETSEFGQCCHQQLAGPQIAEAGPTPREEIVKVSLDQLHSLYWLNFMDSANRWEYLLLLCRAKY